MVNFENIVISKTSNQKMVFRLVSFNENQQAYTTFYALSENGHRKFHKDYNLNKIGLKMIINNEVKLVGINFYHF